MTSVRPRYDALTGVRLFAALWVVLHHVQLTHRRWLDAHHPEVHDVVGPVLMQANRGLDLFFLLSGFVLGLNYLERLGSRLDRHGLLTYYASRVARIWPVYIVATLLAGALIVLRAWKWEAVSTDTLTLGSFARQLFLVQLWTEPRGRDTSWAGPAWSLSAEWLAYALFPFLALAVLWLSRRLGPWAMAGAALVALLPMYVGLFRFQQLSYDYGWAPRVLCLFVAGMCGAAALSKLDPTDRQRRVAGALVPLTVVAVLGWIALTETLLPGWWAGLISILWLPFVACLVVGRGWAVRLLEQRWVVLLGGASFALYLVHGPLLKLFRDVITRTRFAVEPDQRLWAELVFVPVTAVVAVAIFLWWEEPARKVLAGFFGRWLAPGGGRRRTQVAPARRWTFQRST